MHRKILLFMMLSLAAAIGGCVKKTGKLTVAFVTNNAAEFWTYAQRGTEKAAAEFDVAVEFKMPSRGTAEEQHEIVDDLLAKGVKAVAISPKDAKNQVVYLDEMAEFVPLLTQDSDLPPGSKRVCYIGTNNYAAGRDAGKLVKEAMPRGGKVVIFVGSIDVQNAKERRQGVLDELAGIEGATGLKLGNYELLGTKTDEVKADVCKANAEDELAKYQGDPELLCFVGLWAYNPPSLLSAVEGKQLIGKVRIVGFDEEAATLEGIKNGHITGTIVQQPFEFGYQAVRLMAELARGGQPSLPADGIVYVPHQVIRRDDAEAFRAKIEALKRPPQR